MKLRVLIALCFLIQDVTGSGFEGSRGCAEDVGDVGSTACIRQSQYNTHQWTQCLTDEYIQLLTNGTQDCRSLKGQPKNHHCNFPCMYHKYSMATGNVKSPCGCDPANSASGPPSDYTPVLVMPPKCQDTQPTAADCTFYSDCVHEYYLCKDPQYEYFLRYGERFCKLLIHISSFSLNETKAFLGAGRLCLQKELTKWSDTGLCSDFMTLSHKKQKHCLSYPTSADDTAIMCNLGTSDWNRMFWTIRGAEPADTSVALKTVWDTTRGCVPNLAKIVVHTSNTDSTRLVRFIVDFPTATAVTRETSNTIKDNALVNNLASDISKPMKWNEKGVVWFAFASFSNSTVLYIDVLISTRKENDLNAPATVPSVDLNGTIHDLAEKISSTNITFHEDFGGALIEYLACTDEDCVKVDLRVSQSVPRAVPVSAAVAVTMTYAMTLLTAVISSVVWKNLLTA